MGNPVKKKVIYPSPPKKIEGVITCVKPSLECLQQISERFLIQNWIYHFVTLSLNIYFVKGSQQNQHSILLDILNHRKWFSSKTSKKNICHTLINGKHLPLAPPPFTAIVKFLIRVIWDSHVKESKSILSAWKVYLEQNHQTFKRNK